MTKVTAINGRARMANGNTALVLTPFLDGMRACASVRALSLNSSEKTLLLALKIMTTKKMAVVDPEKVEWERVEHPKAPKGMWGKLLSLEEETGAMAVLVKLDKGFHEPKHAHPSDAQVMVLEGKLVDGEVGEIKSGMYWFIPAGVEHGPEDAPDGCVLFIHFNGPAW
ncbi:MAG: DUF4437 domain-containing protein [Candidatus Bathyarchaeota archaeon]|nr:DUF4437 domain-containing protein [Candidatus Bathyarchaeota archaeon]